MSMWNHFESKYERTNNRVECDNINVLDDEEDISDEELDVIVFADVGLAAAAAVTNDEPVRVPCQYCGKLFKPRGMSRRGSSAHREMLLTSFYIFLTFSLLINACSP